MIMPAELYFPVQQCIKCDYPIKQDQDVHLTSWKIMTHQAYRSGSHPL